MCAAALGFWWTPSCAGALQGQTLRHPCLRVFAISAVGASVRLGAPIAPFQPHLHRIGFLILSLVDSEFVHTEDPALSKRGLHDFPGAPYFSSKIQDISYLGRCRHI